MQVDYYGNQSAFQKNVDLEFERNAERYEFLKWAQKSFDNFFRCTTRNWNLSSSKFENLAQVVLVTII